MRIVEWKIPLIPPVHLHFCPLDVSFEETRTKPGAVLQTTLLVIHWLSHPLWKISLRRRQAQTISVGSFSHIIDEGILHLKGFPNCNTGSKVTSIWMNWCNLPLSGVSLRGVCACSSGRLWSSMDKLPVFTVNRLLPGQIFSEVSTVFPLLSTGEQTGALVPFRMWDQNTTVSKRAAHSHFDWHWYWYW